MMNTVLSCVFLLQILPSLGGFDSSQFLIKGKENRFFLSLLSLTHTGTQNKIHSCICVMNVFPKEIWGKSHDEYPVHCSACVCVCICVTACRPCEHSVGVKFAVNIYCMRFYVWTVKAMFCILLTSSHVAVKVGVKQQRQRAEWKTDRGKEGGGKLFTFADGGPL